jgi:hypothetical protein
VGNVRLNSLFVFSTLIDVFPIHSLFHSLIAGLFLFLSLNMLIQQSDLSAVPNARLGSAYMTSHQDEACKELARLLATAEYRDVVNIAKTFSQKFPDLKIPDEKLLAHMNSIQNAKEIVAKWECAEKGTRKRPSSTVLV